MNIKFPKNKIRKNQSIKTILKSAWDYMSKVKRYEKLISGLCQCISCERWFKPEEMELGHFEHHSSSSNGYGTNRIDWDERGLGPQCNYCNHHPKGKIEAAKNWTRKMITKYGDSIIDELKAIKMMTFIISIDEAIQKRDSWKRRYKELK